jgi:hypothetical protein
MLSPEATIDTSSDLSKEFENYLISGLLSDVNFFLNNGDSIEQIPGKKKIKIRLNMKLHG